MSQALIDFGSGPLFRLCFAIMVLGLIRAFVLSAYGMVEALGRAGDRKVKWAPLFKQTVAWLVPAGRFWRMRPIYSTVSIIWHVGIILVPLFFSAHILLWKSGAGISWPALPEAAADALTLVAIAAGVLLFLGRVFDRRSRALSRFQDYAWPLLITAAFVTGYLCVNTTLSAGGYRMAMLLHVASADLIMVLIPFTKVAHCVLMPLSQMVSHVGWRFPAGAGDKVAAMVRKEKAA
ncbi:MAG: hypothetical protein C4523_19490 [Myxococcales bacterium]|nr:MAG: hypothetical protein C4523_19490 [Myxococcales bacterium]